MNKSDDYETVKKYALRARTLKHLRSADKLRVLFNRKYHGEDTTAMKADKRCTRLLRITRRCREALEI